MIYLIYEKKFLIAIISAKRKLCEFLTLQIYYSTKLADIKPVLADIKPVLDSLGLFKKYLPYNYKLIWQIKQVESSSFKKYQSLKVEVLLRI